MHPISLFQKVFVMIVRRYQTEIAASQTSNLMIIKLYVRLPYAHYKASSIRTMNVHHFAIYYVDHSKKIYQRCSLRCIPKSTFQLNFDQMPAVRRVLL